MQPSDFKHHAFSPILNKFYGSRANDFSGQFIKWFLENIFRLDEFACDDACVDAKHDKGVDAVYVDDVLETVILVQSKTKTNPNAELGDTELKDFFGTLQQFTDNTKIDEVIAETKNARLKQALTRNSVSEKISSGYSLKGVFITNVEANDDARNFLNKVEGIELFDAERIAKDYVDLEVDGGVNEEFVFDVSDSDVIDYQAGGAAAKIFLAPALNLTKMTGISDGALFEQNVRLSLGNTKVNKSLRESIREKAEHCNFPLYHNGINVLCEEINEITDQSIKVRNYVVVNGAQSLTSLLTERAKITDDLKIVVKLIEVKGDVALSQKITRNSNNQNAIKARDLKSNHNIQQRLKTEVSEAGNDKFAYEIKQGENNKSKEVITNEAAGLILLATDLELPWSCHQKYKVMDELHSNIFGRPNVTGRRIIALWSAFKEISDALEHLDNRSFASYTLTKYFLAYSVTKIIKDEEYGAFLLSNLDSVVDNGKLVDFANTFKALAITTANDLNAEIAAEDDEHFDYKRDLKSQKWSRATSAKLQAQFKKDVIRKKADPISDMFAGLV